MRILYVVDENISTSSGVVQKIKSKIDFWEKEGHAVKLVSLRSESWDCAIPKGKVLSLFERKVFNKIVNFFKVAELLQAEIDEFCPDIIYARFIFYRPFLVSALKSRCRYVVELNTIDVEELKIRNLIAYYYNLLTRHFFLQNASGFISVTNEILSHASFRKFKKVRCVIGNGIDTTKFIDAVRQNDDKLNPKNIVFIGSPNQTWHGLDKILYLATKCQDYVFHIIGPPLQNLETLSEYKNQINVKVYGYLDEIAARKIIRECQIGISTLALHRKSMKEACPLKSRQYLSQGLPMIVGYNDPDFSNQSFVLNIGNYEDNIKDNLQKIRRFISSAASISPKLIVKFTKENLDVIKKEKTRLDFLEKIKNEE